MSGSSYWSVWGAVLAGLAVLAGAFAAHGLDNHFAELYANESRMVAGEEVPAAQKHLNDFKTAAEYQMYHALGLLAIGLLIARQSRATLHLAGWAFLLGIILFSGSVYALTLRPDLSRLALVTPVGGAFFILGWVCLATGACPCFAKSQQPSQQVASSQQGRQQPQPVASAPQPAPAPSQPSPSESGSSSQASTD